MGNVKIPYYVTRQAWTNSRLWGYWVPTPKMKALGFKVVACGEDGPGAWSVASEWNERWQLARRGNAPDLARVFPAGSIGEAFGRIKALNTWKEKKPRTQEDWERGWKLIEPYFGDQKPGDVTLEDLDDWYAYLLDKRGVREAHRAMKIWRALWRVIAALKTADGSHYCDAKADPSLGIRRKTPIARKDIWHEGEAVRLVKRGWRTGFHGLACVCAVAWDTQLSPVDVRGLTPAQLRGDAEGPFFSVDRAKTGKAAIGTLSKRTKRLIDAYLVHLGKTVTIKDDAPMFRNRSGDAYRKDSLGDDFRTVRALEFPGDKRKLMDFRRSGAVEALAGDVAPSALAGKMANTIDQSRDLQATYLPHNATLVRLADHARSRGRSRMRSERK